MSDIEAPMPSPTPPSAPAPTTPPSPSPAPSPAPLPSPGGVINVAVCISPGLATVTLEKQVTSTSPWNGTSFPPVNFPPFSTANNDYPGYTVFGNVNGAGLQVSVVEGGNTSSFLIANGVSSDCDVA